MGIGKNYSKTQLYWLNSIIGIMRNTYSTFEKKYLPYSDTFWIFLNIVYFHINLNFHLLCRACHIKNRPFIQRDYAQDRPTYSSLLSFKVKIRKVGCDYHLQNVLIPMLSREYYHQPQWDLIPPFFHSQSQCDGGRSDQPMILLPLKNTLLFLFPPLSKTEWKTI